MFCTECKKECTAVLVDFGIGPFEHFGFQGTNVDEEWVSKCCEAETTEDLEEEEQ